MIILTPYSCTFIDDSSYDHILSASLFLSRLLVSQDPTTKTQANSNLREIDSGKDYLMSTYYCPFTRDDKLIPCNQEVITHYLQWRKTKMLDYYGLPFLDNHEGHGLDHATREAAVMHEVF